MANKNPQIVVIGSVDLPSLLIFIHTWQAMHYTPKIMIAASGPDQGQAFLNTLNPSNAEAIMVPDGWYGGVQNALSHVMVEDYIAKFGGTSSDINADVAEAYSAGEALADAVKATKSVSNKRIITYLHGGVCCRPCRAGPVRAGRREQPGEAGLHLPVAERPVRPGTAGRHGARIEKLKPTWQTG